MADIIAKTRYAKSSPRKLRAVARLVRSKDVQASLTILNHTSKKAAKVLAKTLKSAMYNAINNFNFDKQDLTIKSILIDQGPTMSRWRAMARGSGNSFKKRTSHITVILEALELKPKKQAKKTAEKQEPKKTEKEEPKASTKGAKTKVSVRTRRQKKEEDKSKK